VHASSRVVVPDVLAPTLIFFLVALSQPVPVTLPVELFYTSTCELKHILIKNKQMESG
jgi:hypothetical protein